MYAFHFLATRHKGCQDVSWNEGGLALVKVPLIVEVNTTGLKPPLGEAMAWRAPRYTRVLDSCKIFVYILPDIDDDLRYPMN